MSIPENKIKKTKVKVAVKVMTSVALRVLEKGSDSSEQFSNKVVNQ